MNPFQEFVFDDIMKVAIASVVVIAALLSILYIIWGGFLMILSGGSEEKIKPAINHIRHAIIGVLFLIAVLYIFPVFMNLLGLPYGDYAQPRIVFATIGEVFGSMFGNNVDRIDTTLPLDSLPADFSSDF